jgi:hypothetical protein
MRESAAKITLDDLGDDPGAAPPPLGGDDREALRTEANEIQHKLDELRAMVPEAAYTRIETVIERVVALYGAGLGNAIGHAYDAAADLTFVERISNDELLASLLLLHGLHPLPAEERVKRAVVQAVAAIGSDAAQVRFVALDDAGVVVLDAPSLGGGAMSMQVAEAALRRAIENAAPEVTRVIVEGLAAPVPREPPLVQIRSREAR